VQVETLIHADWIIPVEPEDRVLASHSVAIDAGRIVALVPSSESRETFEANTVLELPGQAIIPGLINTHTHTAMTLFRGLADDMPLMAWLHRHIWPAEQRWVSEEFVHDGTQLAVAEMLLGGTTCFNDMYFFPDITARLSAAAGMRATVGLILLDFPSVWAGDADAYVQRGLEVHDQYRNHQLIRTAFAPHAPYSVSNAPLERIRVLADELEIPIHMHVHETRDEIKQGLQQHGNRPLQRLKELGLLSPSLLAVHMTQIEEEEIDEFAASGAHLVHCPESNLKLASGFCPLARMQQAGVNMALGTDGAASNNDLDMFGEMRMAALLAKGISGNASALPAAEVLSMATINGARALGTEEENGSLKPGKSADLVSVDLGGLETQPIYHPISQLVYATGREKVRNVWIAGRQLVRQGELTTLDRDEILLRTSNWQAKIAETDHQEQNQ
jgi:5-methylthioadenosine/S-adenosylhomocysteine deaminase